jgi:hypothetical protein
MPKTLFGRSLMWPMEATTLKSLPRNFLIVLTFVGDSTTTRELAITSLLQLAAPYKWKKLICKAFF